MDKLVKMFEAASVAYLGNTPIKNADTPRMDLHGMLLLDKLDPTNSIRDMITSAEHDEIWLSADPKVVMENITQEQVQELVQCGIMYDEDCDSFHLFA